MADRGRDLKVSILSDLDKFDLDPAANDLESLGRDAKSTAEKVDDAFDKIAKSSRSNFRKVDNDVDKAKKGLDDFKDEAHSTGREAAASFSGGFDDVADAIQETAANAFSGFGPLGAAAGIAAAAGIGFLVTKFNEAKEKAQELRKEFTGLMIEGNGSVSTDSLFNRIQQMAEDGTLKEIATQAKEANINTRDWVRAMAGDREALERVNAELERRIGLLEKDDSANSQQIDRLRARKAQTQEMIDVLAYATDQEDLYSQATQKHAKSLEGVESALKRTGEAQSQFSGDVKLSAGDVVKTLQEQTTAMLDFQKNLRIAAERGDEEFLNWVEQQPANVAAAYASGTAKQRDAVYNAWKQNVGAAQGEGIVAGLDAKANSLVAAGARARKKVEQGAGEGVNIPVTVSGPSAAQIAAVEASIKKRFGTITIPADIKYGQGRYVP